MNVIRPLIIALFTTANAFSQTSPKIGDPEMNDTIPVNAPVTTELAGKTAPTAQSSVFRIIDIGSGSGGTGFLHKSGRVITAAHVVTNPNLSQIKIVLPNRTAIDVRSREMDVDMDLAILDPVIAITAPNLPIHSTTTAPAGMQVSTWGFPEGYGSLVPLLTVGYVSGTDDVTMPSGKVVSRFVINAAFNRGNSGGPVLRLEDGAVIGVVSIR